MAEHAKKYPFVTVGVAAFGGYLLTLSRNYLGDGIQFAMEIETGKVSFMPNHMLYDGSIYLWYGLWRLLGWRGNAIIPLQVFSAFWGAVSVGLFSFLISRTLKSSKVTALVSMGFATSFATWLFSTDVESVTFPLALNLLVLNLLSAPSSDWLEKSRNTVLVGAVTSLAILAYQTGVFMVPAALFGYLLRDFREPALRKRLIIVYLCTVFVIVSGCYVAVSLLVSQVGSLRDFVQWLFFLTKLGGPWGTPSKQSVLSGMFGFLRTLSTFPGLSYVGGIRTFFMFAPLWEEVLLILYYSTLGTLVGYLSFLLVVRWKILFRYYRVLLSLLAVSGMLYAIFAVYWAASDIQFWVPLTVSWWGGIALLLMSYRQAEYGGKRQGFIPYSAELAVAILVGTMVVVNFCGAILPNTKLENNIEYRVAVSIDGVVRNNDLIITTGADRIFLYVPYFIKREVLSIFLVGLEIKTPERVLGEIDRRIEAAISGGNDVYFVGMRPGRFTLWKEMNKMGIDQGIFKRYDVLPIIRVDGEEILKLNTGKKKNRSVGRRGV